MTDALNSLAGAIAKLRNNGIELLSSVAASDADIMAIEKRLGVLLPPSYKSMLSEFGNLAFEGVELFGWTRSGLNATGAPCVIFMTEHDRERELISDQMVLFMVAGYGPSFVLDCAEASTAGEAPVYEISAGGIKRGRDKLADSFGDFFLQEVNRVLD